MVGQPQIARPCQMIAVGYIRVSLEEQARDGYSLDQQEHAIRAYCEALGWELAEVYADRGASGKDIAGRPELRRLLADASRKLFTHIVFWKLDRLGRKTRDILEISDLVDRYGIGLVSLRESFDTATPTGRAFRNILATMAELERDQIIERITVNLHEKAREGNLLGSLPIGYRRLGHEVELDPDTAPKVLQIFQRYATGGSSLHRLAEYAVEIGLTTVHGRAYDANKLRKVLVNPAYVGDVAYYSAHRKKPKAVYPGKHPQLVDRELFDRVQTVLRQQSRSSPLRRGDYGRTPYSLTGVAHCGHCGGPMHGNRSTSKSGATRQYMACGARLMRGTWACPDSPRIRVEVLEQDVAAYLCAMRLPDTDIARVLGELERRARVSAPAAQVQSIESQLERLGRLFVLGDLDEVSYRRQRDELRRRLALIQPTPVIDPQWAVERLHNVGLLWLDVSVEERREVAQELFLRLEITKGALTSITPRPEYAPFFIIDRKARFGQPGPDYPPALPRQGVLNWVPPRGLEPPQPAPEAGALSD